MKSRIEGVDVNQESVLAIMLHDRARDLKQAEEYSPSLTYAANSAAAAEKLMSIAKSLSKLYADDHSGANRKRAYDLEDTISGLLGVSYKLRARFDREAGRVFIRFSAGELEIGQRGWAR